MTLLHVVAWTNNFISLYMNRTGFQCLGSLFMTKNMNTLVTCSDCVNMCKYNMDKMQRKRQDKKNFVCGLDFG